MEKVLLIYSFKTKKSSLVADKIYNEFDPKESEKFNAEELT